MFITIPSKGFHLSEAEIVRMQEDHNCKYLGYWSIKESDGTWGEVPVDVFYDGTLSAGFSQYFGAYKENSQIVLVDAFSAFSSPITGLLCIDEEVIVSRYRNDIVSRNGLSIDGGRVFIHTTGHNNKFVDVFVHNGEFELRNKRES